MTENKNKDIYQKFQAVQEKIGQLAKTGENKFQNYKYVNEYEILQALKPLLKEQKLTLTFDDSEEEMKIQKEGKEWILQYKKRAILTNVEKPEEQLTFKFWAAGQNTDVAKAKGSAETYGLRYFLLKFLMIPTADKLDPDANEVEKLYQLYQEKAEINQTSKDNFFRAFDSVLGKYQGKTDPSNLKSRMSFLNKEDFFRILNFLERMNKEPNK